MQKVWEQILFVNISEADFASIQIARRLLEGEVDDKEEALLPGFVTLLRTFHRINGGGRGKRQFVNVVTPLVRQTFGLQKLN